MLLGAGQLLIAFLSGGTCWDALSCGLNPEYRKIAVDNDPNFEEVHRLG